ncbi:MAG: Peptidase [Chloroflexi bacterium]|nr:MAG: Peptidase [Chloroflexota bacterium]MBA4375184.1 hypothetical protein [Anaerolinea sp.]
MKNKSILVLSAFVTVFLLTIGIGVVTNVIAKNNQANVAPTVDVTAFIQREQAYQQMINEANQKIEQANQQITALMGSVTQESAQDTTSLYLFTADQASAIAQSIAGVTPKDIPIVVNFNGSPAFEVIYKHGNIYIDANTGTVLYNGLEKKSTYITSEQAIKIAKSYLNNNQVTAINFGTFNGSKVYVVIFSNGQSVYIDLTGKIVAVQMASQSSSSSEEPEDHESDDD